MDGEREHDVGAGQGNDEHVRGHELPPPEHQHQDDQQVEDAAHQNWGLGRHLQFKQSFNSHEISLLNIAARPNYWNKKENLSD